MPTISAANTKQNVPVAYPNTPNRLVMARHTRHMTSGESRSGEDVESSSHGLYRGTGSPQFNIALNDIELLWHGQVSVTKTFRNMAQTHINAAFAGKRDDRNSQALG